MFKRIVRAVAVVVLAAGGAVVASMVPAMAYPNCERHVGLPVFDGNNISGPYSVDCTTTVSPATLWGRIKEDRNNQPDVTHDQESVTFTNDRSETVSTTTCQDDDTIYIESQINSEPANQSSGRTMNC